MHNSCKTSNHNAKRHSISMKNQRRFLKREKLSRDCKRKDSDFIVMTKKTRVN